MRILFIHNQYQQAGGEDVAVATEANLLLEKGHEVRTIIFQNTNPSGTIDKLRKGWNAIYNSSSYKKVIGEIKVFKPDVVHVHNLFFVASPSVLFAVKKMCIPVVLTIHNYRLICANALLLRDGHPCELCIHKTLPFSGIKYRCYRKSATESALVTTITGIHKLMGTWRLKINRFILLTEFAKSRFVNSSIKAPDSKLIVKPNFIPDPGTRDPNQENFFLFVGRLSAEKGIEVLLQAFSKNPQQRLVIIGEGFPSEAAAARFMKSSNITFAGKLEKKEVLSYMKRCRALIFPSTWYEGLPYVIIEAFATGTPVIASRLGSMTELIEDGYNGLLFAAGNANDLEHKVSLFLQLEERERQLMNDNARLTYLKKYHPSIHYQTILAIYESVIAEK